MVNSTIINGKVIEGADGLGERFCCVKSENRRIDLFGRIELRPARADTRRSEVGS